MKLIKKLLCKIRGHNLSISGLWYEHNDLFKPSFYGKHCFTCYKKFEETPPPKVKEFLDNVTFD